MCLPVSRLFWVSSLAYPNLLGTKGYVVVVVVGPVFPTFMMSDNIFFPLEGGSDSLCGEA
jgi:hypothetical protein